MKSYNSLRFAEDHPCERGDPLEILEDLKDRIGHALYSTTQNREAENPEDGAQIACFNNIERALQICEQLACFATRSYWYTTLPIEASRPSGSGLRSRRVRFALKGMMPELDGDFLEITVPANAKELTRAASPGPH